MNEVLYIARMVPHYRQAALARLNERLGGRLVVCAGRPPNTSSLKTLARTAESDYPTVPMRNLWIRGERMHIQPFGHVFRRYPRPSAVIAEESVRSVTLPLLLRHAHRSGAACLLWGHFSSNFRPFSARSSATRYRLALARNADGCICYSTPIADLLRPYVPEERLFVAPNTLDTGTLLRLHETLRQRGQTAVRQELGLTGPIIAFIGRLIPRKGIAQLVHVFSLLRERHPSATLVVIGDGPERPSLERAQMFVDGIHVLGAMADWKDSAPYLYAADLLLNPGYLGLSINQAFALGLPVVSQESPDPLIRFHSPEIAYLQHGENGLLSPFGDISAMTDAVEQILADRERYSRNALEYARAHLGLDHMVDGIVQAVTYAEQQKVSR